MKLSYCPECDVDHRRGACALIRELRELVGLADKATIDTAGDPRCEWTACTERATHRIRSYDSTDRVCVEDRGLCDGHTAIVQLAGDTGTFHTFSELLADPHEPKVIQ